MNEFLRIETVLTILAMAAVTYLLRVAGFWLMAHVPLTPRVRAMLEALPGSVVVSIVLPIVAKNGAAAFLAVGAAVFVMLVRRNDILALAVGIGTAALVRATGL